MSVLSEDVVWCYRDILGREPLLDEIVEAQQKTPDFKQMVMDCVRSPEFADRLTRNNSPHDEGALSLPSILNRLSIDVAANEAELEKCASKIKTTWEYLGTEKAHWSVLATDIFLPNRLHESIDSFWASGQAEADLANQMLSQFCGGQFEQKVCVEFGCGVGRLTIGFAKSYKVVHAYDTSRTHLAYAMARAREVGADNIEFHECSSVLGLAIKPCDFFYSVIVLQHNPPPIILMLIRSALKALKPGGMAMFQVPTYIAGYSFNLLNWLATVLSPTEN